MYSRRHRAGGSDSERHIDSQIEAVYNSTGKWVSAITSHRPGGSPGPGIARMDNPTTPDEAVYMYVQMLYFDYYYHVLTLTGP